MPALLAPAAMRTLSQSAENARAAAETMLSPNAGTGRVMSFAYPERAAVPAPAPLPAAAVPGSPWRTDWVLLQRTITGSTEKHHDQPTSVFSVPRTGSALAAPGRPAGTSVSVAIGGPGPARSSSYSTSLTPQSRTISTSRDFGVWPPNNPRAWEMRYAAWIHIL